MVGEAPIPIAQEVIVHVPTIINRHCHHHTEGEMTMDVPAPQTQEEIVQHKKPLIQEEITHVPKIMEQIVPVQRVVEELVVVPQVQIIDEVNEVQVQEQVQAPMVTKVQKLAEDDEDSEEDDAGPRAPYVGRRCDLMSEDEGDEGHEGDAGEPR